MLRRPDRRAPGSCGTGCVARFAVEALRRQHETLLRTNKRFAEDSGRCQAVTSIRAPSAERRAREQLWQCPDVQLIRMRSSASAARGIAIKTRRIFNPNRRRVLASCAVVRPDPLALEWATALALRSLPCPRKAAPCARFRSPCWVRRDRRRRVDQPPHAFHAPIRPGVGVLDRDYQRAADRWWCRRAVADRGVLESHRETAAPPRREDGRRLLGFEFGTQ